MTKFGVFRYVIPCQILFSSEPKVSKNNRIGRFTISRCRSSNVQSCIVDMIHLYFLSRQLAKPAKLAEIPEIEPRRKNALKTRVIDTLKYQISLAGFPADP